MLRLRDSIGEEFAFRGQTEDLLLKVERLFEERSDLFGEQTGVLRVDESLDPAARLLGRRVRGCLV